MLPGRNSEGSEGTLKVSEGKESKSNTVRRHQIVDFLSDLLFTKM